MTGELELLDWRRHVAELYSAVRAESDPSRGHALWRVGRDHLFRTHPQSPLPAGDPLRRTGVPYWPYDPALRFELALRPAPEAGRRLAVPGSDEDSTAMVLIGCVELPPPADAVVDCGGSSSTRAGSFCRYATVRQGRRATAAADTRSIRRRVPILVEVSTTSSSI